MKSAFLNIAGLLVLGAFVTLTWQERRRPLRKRVERGLKHGARNLAVGGLGALTTVLFETPIIQPLTRLVAERRWGILGAVDMPLWLQIGVGLLLMDYTFYAWHVLLHRVPVLWRFHAVHHVDLDLDTSTALRFHFGELLASVPWRAAQVTLIGLHPSTFAIWQVWFALCVMFHHSNLRLPIGIERWINHLLVTPRMHGVHHSNLYGETNSNWSSGLTIWDRLHGTLRLAVPQAEIEIGVPAFENPGSVTLPKLLEMPFVEQPDYWRFADGREPVRRPFAGEGRLVP